MNLALKQRPHCTSYNYFFLLQNHSNMQKNCMIWIPSYPKAFADNKWSVEWLQWDRLNCPNPSSSRNPKNQPCRLWTCSTEEWLGKPLFLVAAITLMRPQENHRAVFVFVINCSSIDMWRCMYLGWNVCLWMLMAFTVMIYFTGTVNMSEATITEMLVRSLPQYFMV